MNVRPAVRVLVAVCLFGFASAAFAQADLGLTKTVSNATPNVGDTITFTVTLQNGGPSSATGVTVTDLLPAGLTFVSATPSQGTYSSGTGAWTVGTVTTVTPQTLAIQAMVASPAARTNTATITASGVADPNAANNTASATETPQQADLAVTKTVSNASPNVGDTITFTVTLQNGGPNSATNVTVTDLLPAGLTFISATPSQGTYTTGSGVWALGTVTTATPQTLAIQAMVASPAARTNTASVSNSDQFDPNTGNNSASATETPQQADLAVTKSSSTATPGAGTNFTWTVTLSNAGPGAATNVTVLDVLPAGVTFVSATPSQGTYSSGTGAWTIGTVSPGPPQTLAITVTAVAAPSTALTNTATVSNSDQFDPNVANNSASSTVTVAAPPADLGLTKTVSNATPNVGDTITFTVTLQNGGPNSATNVTVTDLLPAGLTFVSATPSQGTYTTGTGAWTVGTVTTLTPQTLTIQAMVASPAPRTNTATISASDMTDPNTANNTASATETPQQADLAVTKASSTATPGAGTNFTWTVTLSNAGPSAATNVTVLDVIPAGVTFVSATPSQGTYSSGTGAWTIGTVSPGSPKTLAITVTAVAAPPTALTNTATVSNSDQFDPNVANNSASSTVTVAAPPGAATHFVVAAPANATAGSAFTFTVTALDASNNTATGYTGIVHFTSTDGQAVLPANAALTNGVGTFSATLKTAGSRTITATDTVTASITGTSGAIAVAAGAATHFSVTAPATANYNTAFSFTVTALDAANNTVPGYTGTVHFTSTDASATLPANATLTSGVGTFSATLRTLGSQTLTATDTVTASINGTSGGITVSSTAVTSYSGPSATGSGTITASFTGGGPGCTFSNPQFIPVTGNPASPPAGTAPVSFPHGLFTFTLSGCTPGSTVTMTVTYPATLAAGTQYWKYGPEPANATPHWYVLPATIAGVTATFAITDGGQGDDDLAANGSIVDQGGPGVPIPGSEPIQTPTLSQWALLLLASMILVIGVRRRSVAPA